MGEGGAGLWKIRAPLPPFIPAAFSRCFPGKGKSADPCLGRVFGTCRRREHLSQSAGLFCGGSSSALSAERETKPGQKSSKKGVLSTPSQFPFRKISKGGEGGKEGRKEIKAHLLPREKEQKKKKNLKKKSPFLTGRDSCGGVAIAAFPALKRMSSAAAGRDEEELISADRNFLGNISAFSWRSPDSSWACGDFALWWTRGTCPAWNPE